MEIPAVAYAHDVYGLELDLAPCRRQSPECPFMCAVVRFIRCHTIAVGYLPVDLRVKIRKCGTIRARQAAPPRVVVELLLFFGVSQRNR